VSARSVALEVVRAVHESDAYANLLLPTRITRARLSAADAGFATELAYGTLRMIGYYDVVIALAANRDTARIDPPILDVLRLATHQLLGMRVATHAAVDESVSLARELGSRSATGFVNAVLRTISRSEPEEWRERALATARNADERLAIEFSHPTWVVRALKSALRADGRSDLEELLASDNVPPRVGLVALPGLSSPSDLDADAAALSPLGARARGGDPAGDPLVKSGRARVQDEGSQLAALALSRVRPVDAGERWLDMCAGPGGKAALLAAEARVGGAEFTANEIVPARAGLVRSALEVFGENAPEVTELDGTIIGERHPESFDRILLDAPCTGLGALRRRPEARWRKTPRDVAELAGLQERLLDSAIRALKPGGIVAYVTCSPHVAETAAIVESAQKRNGDGIRLLDTPATLRDIVDRPVDVRGEEHAQLWPHVHGTDAMFIQLIEKAR
jgi:16S rRNA (cytosine967-C5)-methyltransferase